MVVSENETPAPTNKASVRSETMQKEVAADSQSPEFENTAQAPAEKKQAKAAKIATEIKAKREQKKALEQAVDEAKNAKERAGLQAQLIALRKDTSRLVGEARGTLSPELTRIIEKEEERLARSSRNDTEMDFDQEKEKARRLEEEGQAAKDPVKEIAGIILDLEVEGLERIDSPRKAIKANERTVAAGAGSWALVQEKKAQIQIDLTDPVETAQARADLARLVAQEEQAIRGALNSDPQLQQDKAEIGNLREQARDADQALPVLARLEEMTVEAGQQAKKDKILHRPDAGLRLHYINQEKERIIRENISQTPSFRAYVEDMRQISNKYAALQTRFENGEIDARQLELNGDRLRVERNQVEQALLQQMSGERGKYYTPLPPKLSGETQTEYEARVDLDKWVWEKISAIETGNIPPSAFVYSPAYTSLLYALTEANLPKRLKNNINAWRANYEMALVWGASASPADVLPRTSDMDADAFLGLIGQFEKDGDKRVYSQSAQNIHKAFAALERHGYEFTHGSTAESREKIHADIAAELDRNLPEGQKFGAVYERIAYRYWQFLGREGRFDRPMAKATKGDEDVRALEDLMIYRQQPDGSYIPVRLTRGEQIKKGDLIPISETGDKIVGRRTKNRRYDFGYSKTSIKNWYRRLLPGGLWHEKRIKFVPILFRGVNYPTRDFLTDNLAIQGTRSKIDNCVEQISEEALELADWENKAGTYGAWVADLNDNAATRSGAIKADSILNRPVLPDARLRAEIRDKWFETDPDKANSSMVQLLTSEIESHRQRYLFDGIPILGALPIPRFILDQERDEEGNPAGPRHLRLATSEVQASTGIPERSLSRAGVEDLINEWLADGTIGEYEAEKLKQKYLSWLGLPGVGPVRLAARITEAVLNPGNIFGVLWAMISEFLNSALAIPGGKKR